MANFCVEHQQAYFKKGAMKSYAHPIKENGVTVGWCNMPETPAVKAAIEEGAILEGVEDKSKSSPTKSKDDSINRAVALKAAAEIISSSIKAGLIKEKLKETTIELAKKFEKEYLEGE
jgi:hypothetical protein